MTDNTIQPKRRTIALALPGCGTAAVAVIGMLEELQANGIQIDMISACSSTSIVAAAYASNTLAALKHRYTQIVTEGVSKYLKFSFDTGLFSLDSLSGILHGVVPVENIEDLNIPISISASDLVSGTTVTITSGSILRAVQASCAYPGLFEVTKWGNTILVDGGLFTVIPTKEARAFGADVVIAIEMHNQPYIMLPIFLKIKHYLNKFKLAIGTTVTSIQAFREEYSEHRSFRFFRMLGVAVDYAIEEQNKKPVYDCDLLIDFHTGRVKAFEFRNAGKLYEQGRETIREFLPAIRELIEHGPKEKVRELQP